jgi:transposase
VIAGISFRCFYFRLFPGAIKGPQIIEFLNALGRQIRKPLLMIWDGLPAHRSALVREYLEALKGAIQVEQLPAYAPELNPTEYIWGHLKHHELANRCAGDFADLNTAARNRLRSMQRRPTLIRAFWHQAELAHAARDQLRVLRAEVEDQDPIGVDVRARPARSLSRRGNWAPPW